MATALLATKLFLPPPRPGAVRRPRLIERLNENLHGRLTLVSAPAGFGKTSLLSGWLAEREGPVAWLSLDEGDGELARFMAYLVAAVQTIAPDFGEGTKGVLEAPHPPTPNALLTTFINEIAGIPEPFVLVLDDYHLVGAEAIDHAVTLLLEHLPQPMHLVIAAREDPALPLARLRARGQLHELRTDELRFRPAEIAEFLAGVMGLTLTEAEVALLEARTEGWIAGVQMAALSMQGREPDAVLRAFAGSHRFVLDYLAEEVLDRQPEDVREFLLRSSVLERLSADLCTAVTGHARSQEMLERLDRSNLFLLPLDDARRWYRYHHLFAEVLQAKLDDPEIVAELHARASAWFEQRELYAEAIGHALSARDLDRAAALIEHVGPEMRMRRQDATLFRWLAAFPEGFARNRPVLSLDYANRAFAEGDLARAEAFLQNAERFLPGGAPAEDVDDDLDGDTNDMIVANEAEFRRLPARIALSRATYAQARGDPVAAIAYAKATSELVDEGDLLWRGGAIGVLGLAYWAAGKLEEAFTTFHGAVTIFQQAGHASEALGGALPLADIRLAQGRLADALRIYERALARAEAHGEAQRGTMRRVVADLHVGLSEVCFERNRFRRMREHLAKRDELGEHAGLPEHRYRSFLVTARIDAAQGNLEDALERLAAAERSYIRGIFPEVRPIAALRARIRLKQGRLDEASRWVEERELSTTDDLGYLLEFEHITLARVLLARYRNERSSALHAQLTTFLRRLLEAAERGGRAGSVRTILVLQALAFQAQGDHTRALEVLARALRLAEPEGHVRVFLDEGPAMAELLTQATRDPGTPAYASTLLTAFPGWTPAPSGPPGPAGVASSSPHAPPGLLEPLTRRELEVLALLARGHSNKEISRELHRALDTIKGHNRNIFGKLQAQNRTQAVARARELGLL